MSKSRIAGTTRNFEISCDNCGLEYDRYKREISYKETKYEYDKETEILYYCSPACLVMAK